MNLSFKNKSRILREEVLVGLLNFEGGQNKIFLGEFLIYLPYK